MAHGDTADPQAGSESWISFKPELETDDTYRPPPLPSPVFEKALAFEDATDLFRGGRDVASRERYMR